MFARRLSERDHIVLRRHSRGFEPRQVDVAITVVQSLIGIRPCRHGLPYVRSLIDVHTDSCEPIGLIEEELHVLAESPMKTLVGFEVAVLEGAIRSEVGKARDLSGCHTELPRRNTAC